MGFLRKFWNWLFVEDENGSSFRRFAAVITVFIALLVLVFNEDNLYRWIKAGIEIRNQERQKEWYMGEIERLDTEIETLKNDKDSLETFAREEFLFAAPGEDVYIEE